MSQTRSHKGGSLPWAGCRSAQPPGCVCRHAEPPLLLPDQLCAWVRCLTRAVLLREEALRTNLAFLPGSSLLRAPPYVGCESYRLRRAEGRSSFKLPDGAKRSSLIL